MTGQWEARVAEGVTVRGINEGWQKVESHRVTTDHRYRT